MQKELELFKNLFQEFPNIEILHISNKISFLDSTLYEVVKALDGKLTYIDFKDELSLKLKSSARDFEYIILSDILSYCQNKEKIVKTMYKALENSANIIVLEKKSHNNLEEIKELLEKNSFVAINHIDLFKEYNLITAKKLHMWGSGL